MNPTAIASGGHEPSIDLVTLASMRGNRKNRMLVLLRSLRALRLADVDHSSSKSPARTTACLLPVVLIISSLPSLANGNKFELMMAAAERGDAAAQLSIGLSFYFGVFVDGTEVPRDNDEAVFWLTKSADNGNAFAQLHLGRMYAAGAGVEKNDSIAAELFLAAAKSGSAEARVRLAQCYLDGRGVTANSAEAYAWATLAAFQGNAEADRLATSVLPKLKDHAAATRLAETYFVKFGVSDPYPSK